MRKFAAIIMAGLSLSGCGPSNEAQPDSKQATAPAAPIAAPQEHKITPTADLGKVQFRRCVACHTVDQGGHHGVGPNLHDIIGKEIGALPDFTYSDAMRNKGGIWDEAAMDAFLANPKENMPGNRMIFGGVKEAADRKALYLYLKEAK